MVTGLLVYNGMCELGNKHVPILKELITYKGNIIHLFNNYLLSIFYMPATLLNTNDTVVKMELIFCWEKTGKNQTDEIITLKEREWTVGTYFRCKCHEDISEELILDLRSGERTAVCADKLAFWGKKNRTWYNMFWHSWDKYSHRGWFQVTKHLTFGLQNF